MKVDDKVMAEVFMAGQTIPYELSNRKILFSKEKTRLLSLVDIVLQTHPNYNKSDIKNLFKDLSETGCTYSTYANAIIEQLRQGKSDIEFLDEFKNLFGYSLYDEKNGFIDYNRLLVDIYSTLYNLGKLQAVWYEEYHYETLEQAVIDKVKGDLTTESSLAAPASLLFKAGYTCDGFNSNGHFVIKERNPSIVTVIGTYQDLASKVFNKDCSDLSNEQIKALFKNENIEINEEEFENKAKTNGLLANNTNFWLNEFFKRRKIDLEIEVETKPYCINTPSDLVTYVENALQKKATISISGRHGTETWMQELNAGKLSWTIANGKKVGHSMLFSRFNEDGNIILISYGKEFLMPIEFCKNLDVGTILVRCKPKIYAEENNVEVPKY